MALGHAVAVAIALLGRESSDSDSGEVGVEYRVSHIVLAALYLLLSLLSLVSLTRRIASALSDRSRRKQLASSEGYYSSAVTSSPTASRRRQSTSSSKSSYHYFPTPTSVGEQQQQSQSQSPNQMGSLWMRWFHCFFVLGCWGRCAYCLMDGLRFHSENQPAVLICSFVPPYFFFSCYWLVLACWAELYHNTLQPAAAALRSSVPSQSPHVHGQQKQKKQQVQVQQTQTATTAAMASATVELFMKVVNSLMLGFFGLCVAIYVVSMFALEDTSWVEGQIRFVLHCATIAIYFALGVGFLVYSVLIFTTTVRHFSTGRPRNVLLRISSVAALCFACFVGRGATVSYQLSLNYPLGEEHWWIDFVYYTTTELIPLALLLAVLTRHAVESRGSKRQQQSLATDSVQSPLIGPTAAAVTVDYGSVHSRPINFSNSAATLP